MFHFNDDDFEFQQLGDYVAVRIHAHAGQRV